MSTLETRLKALKAEPVEWRLERLERAEADNWHLMMEAMDAVLNAYIEMEQSEDEKQLDEPLPEIEDRRSFIAYVSLVARKQHAGKLTGKEAGALLYAAQLVYAALKGGEVHGLTHQAALP